jgi:transcriptional repressor of cell division inhibition gene dicB
MQTKDVIAYFGDQVKAAAALGITPSAVSQWGETPPMVRQYQIQVITKGKLKVSQKRETAA